MSVNFKPLADRVLIEPIAAETKTASGIIIPDTAKEKPQEGTVVAVGPAHAPPCPLPGLLHPGPVEPGPPGSAPGGGSPAC